MDLGFRPEYWRVFRAPGSVGILSFDCRCEALTLRSPLSSLVGMLSHGNQDLRPSHGFVFHPVLVSGMRHLAVC